MKGIGKSVEYLFWGVIIWGVITLLAMLAHNPHALENF